MLNYRLNSFTKYGTDKSIFAITKNKLNFVLARNCVLSRRKGSEPEFAIATRCYQVATQVQVLVGPPYFLKFIGL